MKRIVFFGLVLMSFFSACQKDDTPIPGEGPDERLNATLNNYKTLLVSSEFGWKAVLSPSGGSGYSFLMKFNQNNRVTMSSDINAGTTVPFESSFRLKAIQQPSLLFDTYSYIHVLSDPDANVSGGDWGHGKYSDFEFSFESATEETINLKGVYQNSRLTLVKATREDAENYINNVLASAKAIENLNLLSNFYFKRLSIGNNSFDVVIQPESRTINFYNAQGSRTGSSFYYTENGIRLVEPFSSDGITMTDFSDIRYNAASRTFSFTASGVAGTIREAATPIGIDPQAARRFYNSPPNGYYWSNQTGFTVEGRIDAFDVMTIEGYEGMVLYPQIDPPYDGLFFETAGGGFFGPAFRTQFPNNGRIRFTYAGQFGTTPEQASPMVTATRTQMAIPEGYYVIQVGDAAYDLVSALDAKTWIHFEE